MKYILLLMFLLTALCSVSRATVLAGTFKYPDGSVVNGRLLVRLERSGILNTCVTPSVLVPTVAVNISITNGVIQGSPDITPSDCMNTFQSYRVQLVDSNQKNLFIQYWYITQAGGGFINPTGGSAHSLHPVGLTMAGNGNDIAFTVPSSLAGFRSLSSATGSVTGSGSKVVNVAWTVPQTSGTYGVVCSVLDGTTPTVPTLYVSAIGSITSTTMAVTISNSGTTRSGTLFCRGRAL